MIKLVGVYDRVEETVGQNDRARDMAVDINDNVYVSGYSANDYATIKYSPTGVQKWVKRYSGPGYGEDDGIAIAVDASGNAYVTGSSGGSGTLDDFATLKYAR